VQSGRRLSGIARAFRALRCEASLGIDTSTLRGVAQVVGFHAAGTERQKRVSDHFFFPETTRNFCRDLGWLLFTPAQSTIAKYIPW